MGVRENIENYLRAKGLPSLSYFERGNTHSVSLPPVSLPEPQPTAVYDVTPLSSKLFARASSELYRIKKTGVIIPCIFQIRRIRCKILHKQKPPEISFKVTPRQVDKMIVHLCPWDLRIEGKITGTLENHSKEGKECTKRRYEEEWHCETVEGTANLTGNSALNYIREAVTDEAKVIVNNIKNTFPDVAPNNKVSATYHFVTKGAWNWIQTILDYIWDGKIRLKDEITATVHYEWPKGSKQEIKRTFSYSSPFQIPVKSVELAW